MNIKIEPYDLQWPEKFRQLKSLISGSLGTKALAIEHIGSTSVPGMKAKPIIDILTGVENNDSLNGIEDAIIKAGFTYIRSEKHIAQYRRTFFKYENGDRLAAPQIVDVSERDLYSKGFIETAHIHCWIWNSPDWERHLAFRDYLISHPGVRLEYQKLKETLGERDWESSLAYSQVKNSFIKGIEQEAIAWYRTRTV